MSKKSKARTKAEKDPALSAKRRRAMVQYLAIMFTVAIVLVVLSLFITLRNQKATMNDQKKASLGLQENAAKLQQKNNAYELLTKAQLDYSAGDMDTFVDDFEELMSISDVLTDNGERLYSELYQIYQAAVSSETTDAAQTD